MALGSATGWKSSGTYCYPGSIGGPDFQEKRNASGFTALPAGFRFYHGEFVDRGTQASWWTSTEYLTTQAFVWVLSYNEEDTIQIGSFGNYGHSVRCLKD